MIASESYLSMGTGRGSSRTHQPCPGCGARQRIDFDTDGFGRLVETVEPCKCKGSPILAQPPSLGKGGKRGMYSKGGQLRRLAEALLQGMSIRAAARHVGCAKATAARLRKELLAQRLEIGLGEIYCPCGKPSNHRGWCPYRLSQSPARRGVLARLHEKQRGAA